jgi:hypothetical protein
MSFFICPVCLHSGALGDGKLSKIEPPCRGNLLLLIQRQSPALVHRNCAAVSDPLAGCRHPVFSINNGGNVFRKRSGLAAQRQQHRRRHRGRFRAQPRVAQRYGQEPFSNGKPCFGRGKISLRPNEYKRVTRVGLQRLL